MADGKVDWNSFDGEQLSLIEDGVELLEGYVAAREERPSGRFIKSLLLDDFIGFEDATPEMKDAIVERATARWEELHGIPGHTHGA